MKILDLLFSTLVVFQAQPDIYLEVVAHPEKHNWAILAPHENENIVNGYVAEQVQKHGGIFVVLRQEGGRNIEFNINGQKVAIDPNRLFSERGVTRSISMLNPEVDASSETYQLAVKRAAKLADLILKTLKADAAKSWLAVHNNTHGYTGDGNNGIGTVSIKRYQKKLAAGANYLIKVNDAGHDEDDLFFITEPEDFKIMQDAGWNVVLQNPAVATDTNEDDGSLSVLAEKQNKRYINIEAERAQGDFGSDHITEQKAMVDLTFKILLQEMSEKP